MFHQAYISSYLESPDSLSAVPASKSLHHVMDATRTLHRYSFKLWKRFIIGNYRRGNFNVSLRLVIWTAVLVGGAWAGGVRALPGEGYLANTAFSVQTGVSATDNSTLASAKPVNALPGGPSGQLLPPGTLAPFRTFRNTYTAGQCTWYVASRVNVPSNWGNANTWYSRAGSAGWKTGSTPAIGAIATTTAGWYGHVAVVTAVNGSTVTVQEMNYKGPFIEDTRTTKASDFRYIYR